MEECGCYQSYTMLLLSAIRGHQRFPHPTIKEPHLEQAHPLPLNISLWHILQIDVMPDKSRAIIST